MSEETLLRRAAQAPFVTLFDVPGIGAVFKAIPEVGIPARQMAEALLVLDIPGVNLTRPQRELIATYVSTRNDCEYCKHSHGAVAEMALHMKPGSLIIAMEAEDLDSIDAIDDRMRAFLKIAGNVQQGGMVNNEEDVQIAYKFGATEKDVLFVTLIAGAFCMYNRWMDGLRAITPTDDGDYQASATKLLEWGYVAQPSSR